MPSALTVYHSEHTSTSQDLICKAYQIEPSKICALVFYDQAMAFKVMQLNSEMAHTC